MSDPALERYGGCTLDQDGCVTCGDVAVPARVLAVDGAAAEVEDRVGNRASVAIDFVPEARPGDLLLVHGGVAIATLTSQPERSEGTMRLGMAPSLRSG
jgi:hydrogenase expression/formation protein HypC